MKGIVRHHQDTKEIPLGGGTERRILAYDDALMAVEVSFETGSEGAPHTHPHTQLSYVLSGSRRPDPRDDMPRKRRAAGRIHPKAGRFPEGLNKTKRTGAS